MPRSNAAYRREVEGAGQINFVKELRKADHLKLVQSESNQSSAKEKNPYAEKNQLMNQFLIDGRPETLKLLTAEHRDSDDDIDPRQTAYAADEGRVKAISKLTERGCVGPVLIETHKGAKYYCPDGADGATECMELRPDADIEKIKTEIWDK